MNLKSLLTPCLILDEAKLQNNVDRMTAKIKSLGGDLRPHVKTSKLPTGVSSRETMANRSKWESR